MPHKMIFAKFALRKVDFSLNEDFKEKEKIPAVSPELALNHEVREQEKELVVSVGVRLVKGNIPYYFEVIGVGLFKFENIPDAKILEQLATINCPAILFPYIRETIADLTRRGGFPPLHLDPINFVDLAKNRPKQ